jgi:acyl-CoA synthetase (AMP-forming)/AMP-acid ligase II
MRATPACARSWCSRSLLGHDDAPQGHRGPRTSCELRPQELRRFAREHLIHYKVPRVFEIRSAMPRSATGKILLEQLQRESG